MNSVQKKYHSYLLRLWQVQKGEGSGMRASLEDVQTRELHGFEDLDALVAFLEELETELLEEDMSLKQQPD